MTWLDALQHLNSQQIAVRHEPMTPRYQRAAVRLAYGISNGVYLGARPHDELPNDQAVEIAAWAARPSGRGSGYYACFRLFLELDTPVFAVLFAFYDGLDNSPALSTIHAARGLALSEGFHDDQAD